MVIVSFPYRGLRRNQNLILFLLSFTIRLVRILVLLVFYFPFCLSYNKIRLIQRAECRERHTSDHERNSSKKIRAYDARNTETLKIRVRFIGRTGSENLANARC